jgi:hypothetical protein
LSKNGVHYFGKAQYSINKGLGAQVLEVKNFTSTTASNEALSFPTAKRKGRESKLLIKHKGGKSTVKWTLLPKKYCHP